MQKTIKVIAVIAVIMVALAFLLLLIGIPLQRAIAMKVFSYPENMVAYLPIVPVTPLLRCLLLLGCTILLAVCAGKKGIILPEILLLIVLIGVIPSVNTFLPSLVTRLLAYTKGEYYVAANSVADMISNYCLLPATLGNSLALVACGMNMVHKRMSKKLDQTAA